MNVGEMSVCVVNEYGVSLNVNAVVFEGIIFVMILISVFYLLVRRMDECKYVSM
jgi:hypothetical protein